MRSRCVMLSASSQPRSASPALDDIDAIRPIPSTAAMAPRSVIIHVLDLACTSKAAPSTAVCVLPSQPSRRVCVAAGDQDPSPSLSSCVHDDGCDKEAVTQRPCGAGSFG
uniref:Uncharacterized protein n=1 Tax=Vitrella brassicaformis TaxID=1169539 RepID=A0A7S1KAU7_9ALVE